MEDIPPSYFQSMNPSVLDLVAPYLDTLSLHALTLVSRSYNETFMPHLWGSPASHFVPMVGSTLPGDPDNPQANGSHDDMVYVALTRFKRTLKKARFSTRCLVHTLFLPPALSEIYGGPNATWLKEILDGLPNLQSLCVGGLPFFDHHSLVAVDRQKGATPGEAPQLYPLKLLIASKEPNTTSFGLSLFLPRIRNLVYLDLSYTTPARDTNVLSTLCMHSELQVLKLRGIGLRDAEAEVLANAIGLNVRLLDVAENLLSDMAVRSLLQACFPHQVPMDQHSAGAPPTQYQFSARRLESWPVSLPPAPDFLSLDTLRSSNLDQNLRIQLTNPLTGRLAFEDIPHAGLTHLYITGNPAVTIEGIRSLLNTGKLHVLDAGEIAGETVVDKYVRSAIDTGRFLDRPRSLHSASASIDSATATTNRNSNYDADINFPGAEKLIPILREKASNTLTYLRIDHALVTKNVTEEANGDEKKSKQRRDTTSSPRPTSPVELSAQIGMTQLVEAPGNNHLAVELPTEQVFELDATPTFRAELPGDIIHFALTPPVGEKPQLPSPVKEQLQPIRGEGPFAPEVVVSDADAGARSGTKSSNNSKKHQEGPATTVFSPVSPISPQAQTFSTNSTDSSNPISLDAVLNTPSSSKPSAVQSTPPVPVPDRRAKIDALVRSRPSPDCNWLCPASLPNLRTLILTNIPSQVPANSSILSNIKRFITLCSIESHLSLLRARTDYSLPPGRARFQAERKHARSIFALETIVLEVAPLVQAAGPRAWKHTRQQLNISKSSTGDHDSEALWSAAENDFSFFGEEGEEQDECGIYEHEPGKYFPQIKNDDKIAVYQDDPESSIVGTPIGMYDPELRRERTPTPVAIAVGPTFKSPRELPLGRNRRPSNESRTLITNPPNNRLSIAEMQGTIPHTPVNITPTPTPSTIQKSEPDTPMVDVISELSKFRKDRKAAYEAEVYNQTFRRVNGVTVRKFPIGTSTADMEVFVQGHWKGEIKVIRTDGKSHHRHSFSGDGKGRFQRNGMVDIYGNYFEKGYLYS